MFGKFKDDYEMMLAGDMTDDHHFEPSPTDGHDQNEFKRFESDADFGADAASVE